MPKAFPVIISAPSGAGKSTICRELLRRHRGLVASVSWTTRGPRPGEVHGRHYFFVEQAAFRRKIRSGGFLEWARVHGHLYGTPRDLVSGSLRRGRSVLMAIDVQGGASIARKIADAVRVFILPPSWEVLRKRLIHRKDPEETVARRLANARSELKRAGEYQYLVVNDRLNRAVGQVETILAAERLRVSRNTAVISRFR